MAPSSDLVFEEITFEAVLRSFEDADMESLALLGCGCATANSGRSLSIGSEMVRWWGMVMYVAFVLVLLFPVPTLSIKYGLVMKQSARILT